LKSLAFYKEHFATAQKKSPLVNKVKTIRALRLFSATLLAFLHVLAPLAVYLVAALLNACEFHAICLLGLLDVIFLVAALAPALFLLPYSSDYEI